MDPSEEEIQRALADLEALEIVTIVRRENSMEVYSECDDDVTIALLTYALHCVTCGVPNEEEEEIEEDG